MKVLIVKTGSQQGSTNLIVVVLEGQYPSLSAEIRDNLHTLSRQHVQTDTGEKPAFPVRTTLSVEDFAVMTDTRPSSKNETAEK